MINVLDTCKRATLTLLLQTRLEALALTSYYGRSLAIDNKAGIKVVETGGPLRPGPLAEANWAKQRLGRATQALPNGFCSLPVQKTCPHANACFSELTRVRSAEVDCWPSRAGIPRRRRHERTLGRSQYRTAMNVKTAAAMTGDVGQFGIIDMPAKRVSSDQQAR
jgi:hypothetical protein